MLETLGRMEVGLRRELVDVRIAHRTHEAHAPIVGVKAQEVRAQAIADRPGQARRAATRRSRVRGRFPDDLQSRRYAS